MSAHPSPSVITHFLPPEALRAARELSRRFQREEIFRQYVARRALAVLPVGFLIVILSGFCTTVVLKGLVQFSATPAPDWLLLLALVLALLTFFGGIATQLYLLFFGLGKLAYRQAGIAVATETIVPAVWMCLLIFVVIPLMVSLALPSWASICAAACR